MTRKYLLSLSILEILLLPLSSPIFDDLLKNFNNKIARSLHIYFFLVRCLPLLFSLWWHYSTNRPANPGVEMMIYFLRWRFIFLDDDGGSEGEEKIWNYWTGRKSENTKDMKVKEKIQKLKQKTCKTQCKIEFTYASSHCVSKTATPRRMLKKCFFIV